jgi:hypothetical protein
MITIIISAIVVCILSASALYFSRREPTRNGYQRRRRTRIKGARTIISESQHPIVDEGAWQTRRAEYPRETEPRGM